MKELIIRTKFSSTYPHTKPHPTCRISTMWNRSHTHHLLLILTTCLLFLTASGSWIDNGVFLQLPFSNPPTVRPPPYANSNEKCPGLNERENWVGNLCGDLNSGYIPLNPLSHRFGDDGTTMYPFDIIKNKTLLFFRHALPVLKNDKSLPKVARFNPYVTKDRPKRSLSKTSSKVQDVEDDPMEARAISHSHALNHNSDNNRFCENHSPASSLMCRVYNVMWRPNNNQHHSKNRHHIRDYDTREPHETRPKNYRNQAGAGLKTRDYLRQRERQPLLEEATEIRSYTKLDAPKTQSISLPPTPCASSAEYLTPVFARNHEGAWRYVVQIPREGYFTQTVEVTKCAETNCYYMDGTCRTSPRWQSLLVAEVFYPDTEFPVTKPFQSQPKSKRSRKSDPEPKGKNNELSNSIPPQCDGIDEIGCFQVRLFYDWFLIPGSCKCWKKQFDFTRV